MQQVVPHEGDGHGLAHPGERTRPVAGRGRWTVAASRHLGPAGLVQRVRALLLRGRAAGDPARRVDRARRSIWFNGIALVVFLAGSLNADAVRTGLLRERDRALGHDVRTLAGLIETRAASADGSSGPVGEGPLPAAPAEGSARLGAPGLVVAPSVGEGPPPGIDLRPGETAFVFDPAGGLLGRWRTGGAAPADPASSTAIAAIRAAAGRLWPMGSPSAGQAPLSTEDLARTVRSRAQEGATIVERRHDRAGATILVAGTPIRLPGAVTGVVAITSPAGDVDGLVRHDRAQVLRMVVIAGLVSIGLSLGASSTAARPDPGSAARDQRPARPGRARLPDLVAPPDEIGRLSAAMRDMVAALYDRIDANEQFAADVAHEIKNPLASLRSAVGTMRVARREDQRDRLLGVIEHDVRRLDRLVSDISNASRLDSDLVKDEEEEFDLVATLQALGEHLGAKAADDGVDLGMDVPTEPIRIRGLESRLAQVFVNLIGNALSFCQPGDAVRVWIRRRDDRVLVVVEDTGPGIPEEALSKVFQRFYSERPAAEFGDHSGLGLAISRQIVEAHGGVIWAENIRPTRADVTSDPLGARFVVGLPV